MSDLRDQLAAAIVAAAHNCFDHDDADMDDCQCQDPIYVSGSTANTPTEVSGSPHAVADAVRPVLDVMYREWREHAAKTLDDCAANYPPGVFPPGSDSPDAIAGTAMRFAYRRAARIVRDLQPPSHDHDEEAPR